MNRQMETEPPEESIEKIIGVSTLDGLTRAVLLLEVTRYHAQIDPAEGRTLTEAIHVRDLHTDARLNYTDHRLTFCAGSDESALSQLYDDAEQDPST